MFQLETAVFFWNVIWWLLTCLYQLILIVGGVSLTDLSNLLGRPCPTPSEESQAWECMNTPSSQFMVSSARFLISIQRLCLLNFNPMIIALSQSIKLFVLQWTDMADFKFSCPACVIHWNILLCDWLLMTADCWSASCIQKGECVAVSSFYTLWVKETPCSRLLSLFPPYFQGNYQSTQLYVALPC